MNEETMIENEIIEEAEKTAVHADDELFLAYAEGREGDEEELFEEYSELKSRIEEKLLEAHRTERATASAGARSAERRYGLSDGQYALLREWNSAHPEYAMTAREYAAALKN